MDLRRRLLDLTDQRARELTAAEAALDANEQDTYNSAMSNVAVLDEQIAQVQALIDARERTPAAPPTMPQNTAPTGGGEALRASNEYVRAFCAAVRSRVSPATAQGERYAPLMDALTEGVDENGGFLVPVDLQTRINELKRQLVSLRSLVTVEHVTTRTGYRVLDTKPTAGFTQMDEMAEIPQDDQPAFKRIGYSVKDYGLIVPVSNDLLQDNDAGLLEYLARWMARKSTLTENSIILSLLSELTPTSVAAGEELAAIKTALNVTLDPDIALGASILTNQTGYNLLDQLTDDNLRPLMQPDVTTGTGYQIKGKHVTAVSNAIMADDAAGALMYVGDLSQYITIFDRMVMEYSTTNIGGDAWRTNSTEGRAIMRLDAQVIDDEAAVALVLAGAAG